MSDTIAVLKSARSLRMLTAELLVSGGDERLRLNAQGVNTYGCPPTPNDAVLSFSSSTASIISDENFRSLEQYIARLQNEIKETDELTLYEREKKGKKMNGYRCFNVRITRNYCFRLLVQTLMR